MQWCMNILLVLVTSYYEPWWTALYQSEHSVPYDLFIIIQTQFEKNIDREYHSYVVNCYK
jgi:hypothetical protein